VPGILHANDFCVLDEAHTLPGVATDHLGVGVSDYALRRQLLRLYNPNTQKGLLVRHAEGRGLRVVDIALGTVQRFFALASDTLLKESDVVRLPHPEWAPTLLHEPLGELVSTAVQRGQANRRGLRRRAGRRPALLLAHYNGGGPMNAVDGAARPRLLDRAQPAHGDRDPSQRTAGRRSQPAPPAIPAPSPASS
jgi:hypothetical protein